jgi:hypothetical protein
MAASNAPEQNSVTTRDTLISTISTRAVLLGAYVAAWREAAKETHKMSEDTFGDRKRECASQWESVGDQIILKPLKNAAKWDNGEIEF